MLSPSPFSVYASNFLKRGGEQEQLDASQASSQPLFYSATAGESGSDDGDPFRGGDETPGAHSVIDDDSVPRLAGAVDEPQDVLFDARQESSYLDDMSGSRRTPIDQRLGPDMTMKELEDDDVFPGDLDDLPAMDSELYDSVPHRVRRGISASQSALNSALLDQSLPSPPQQQQHQPGWRSHQAEPTTSRPSSRPQPSSSPSQHYAYSDEDDDPNVPPAYLTAESSASTTPPPMHVPPTRTAMSVQLNESLLPRDGVSRTLFYLPDPDRPVGRNKYHDPEWMSIWLSAVSICAVGSVLIFFVTDVSKPSLDIELFCHLIRYAKSSSTPHDSDPPRPIPYSTLTHAIPLLTVLTIASAGVSYGYLMYDAFSHSYLVLPLSFYVMTLMPDCFALPFAPCSYLLPYPHLCSSSLRLRTHSRVPFSRSQGLRRLGAKQ